MQMASPCLPPLPMAATARSTATMSPRRSSGGQFRQSGDLHPRRVSAELIERTIASAIDADTDRTGNAPFDCVARITMLPGRLVVVLKSTQDGDTDPPRLIVPFQCSARAGRSQIIAGRTDGPRRDLPLIRALRQAHARLQRDPEGTMTLAEAPAAFRARRILRLAFLAPELQRAILDGTQPRQLTLARFIDSDIPLLWSDQKRLFATLS